MTDLEQIKSLIEAVANVGVDFGFGEFQINENHIETARYLDQKIKDKDIMLSVCSISESETRR